MLEAVPAATVLKDRRSCKIKLIVVLLVLVLASVGATVGILLGNNNSGNNSSQPVTSSPQPATCDFCFGGQNVSSTLTDVELETVLVADNVTCLDYLKSQQMLLSNDTECLVGQALAWRRCGCPLMPTISNGNCTLCDNNNNNNQTPPVPLNAGVNCDEEANFVSVVGTRRPDQCNALVEEASASCQCPSAYYSMLLGIVSDAVEDPALFRTAGSTQIRALDWMAYQDPLRLEMSLTPSQIRERFGAVVLYYSLGGGPSTTDLNTYFLTGNITCEWHHPTFADGLFCADETVTDFLLGEFFLFACPTRAPRLANSVYNARAAFSPEPTDWNDSSRDCTAQRSSILDTFPQLDWRAFAVGPCSTYQAGVPYRKGQSADGYTPRVALVVTSFALHGPWDQQNWRHFSGCIRQEHVIKGYFAVPQRSIRNASCEHRTEYSH